MNFLDFVFSLLCLVSIDTILGFLVYMLWKYFDMKYFSQLEITMLKNENEYLKQQNKKIDEKNSDNWGDGYNNLY